MISAFKYIICLVLTLVLPLVATVLTAILLAVIISTVASTMGYDFTQQYQAILKDGFVFVVPGILSVIGTILYWSDQD